MCPGTLCTLSSLSLFCVPALVVHLALARLSAEHVAVLAVLAVLLFVLAVLLLGPQARERAARPGSWFRRVCEGILVHYEQTVRLW